MDKLDLCHTKMSSIVEMLSGEEKREISTPVLHVLLILVFGDLVTEEIAKKYGVATVDGRTVDDLFLLHKERDIGDLGGIDILATIVCALVVHEPDTSVILMGNLVHMRRLAETVKGAITEYTSDATIEQAQDTIFVKTGDHVAKIHLASVSSTVRGCAARLVIAYDIKYMSHKLLFECALPMIAKTKSVAVFIGETTDFVQVFNNNQDRDIFTHYNV